MMYSRLLAVVLALLATTDVLLAAEEVTSNRELAIDTGPIWIENPSLLPSDGNLHTFNFSINGILTVEDDNEFSYVYEVKDQDGVLLWNSSSSNTGIPNGAIGATLTGYSTFQLACTSDMVIQGGSGISAIGTSTITVTVEETKNGTGTGNTLTNTTLVECIPAPDLLGSGGSFGDPHVMKWNGVRFDYHGECDLVLLKNPSFANGLGLDIHIRTKILQDWSFISSAAVKIGSKVLEISSKGIRYLNGVFNAKIPARLSGFPIRYSRPHSDGDKWHTFTVDLGDGQSIVIKSFMNKSFVHVTVNSASKEVFGSSVGLMGEFGTGRMLMRDGVTIEVDPNTFSQDWQVLESEPHLFNNKNRFPQHPQKCTLPSQTENAKVGRRRLGESIAYSTAEKACAKWDEADREDCIFDVMATGDLELADAGSY